MQWFIGASCTRWVSAYGDWYSLLHDLSVMKYKIRQIERRRRSQWSYCVHVKGDSQCHVVVARPTRVLCTGEWSTRWAVWHSRPLYTHANYFAPTTRVNGKRPLHRSVCSVCPPEILSRAEKLHFPRRLFNFSFSYIKSKTVRYEKMF